MTFNSRQETRGRERSGGAQAAMAEQGAQAAMAEQGAWAAMADRGAWAAMVDRWWLGVHGRSVVVGPEPEQSIKGGVIPRRRRGELAELPGVLVEGEVLTG